MHNKYRARTNKLLGSLAMVRCPKALFLSEENMTQMGRGWLPLLCGAEMSSVLLSCSLLISRFVFCLSYQNSSPTFMLLSVRISAASLMLLICLTWWGFHVFFHTLIIFSIKVTEIRSPISNLALNERQWNTCMKGCSAFSHAVPSSDEYNLYLRWSSLSLFIQVAEPWLKPTSLLQL